MHESYTRIKCLLDRWGYIGAFGDFGVVNKQQYVYDTKEPSS